MASKQPQDQQAAHSARLADSALQASRAIEQVRPEERGPLLRNMIETAVRRLTVIVDEETEALRKGVPTDFKAANTRKSLALVELSRALELLEGVKPDPSIVRLIDGLNAKLDANRKMLKLHLQAVGEIAGIIAQSIREAESDGTYTLSFRSKGQRP